MDEWKIVYGRNPVRELLIAAPERVSKLMVASGSRWSSLDEVLNIALQNGINVEYSERRNLDRLSQGGSHQGIVAFVKGFKQFSLHDVIREIHPRLKGKVVVALDGVTDPQNLGAIVRTAHCFGVNGILIPRHRSVSVTPVVVKTSAGAINYTPVITVTNLASAIDFLKKEGFWVYGAEADAPWEIDALRFDGDVALVVGGEEKGIRPLIREKCDFLFAIPMVGKINSLNVSVATGVALYTIFSKLRKS
ncbi:MAG: 23S rRNA (guanosine(2251)-2'-O)-methyltransferase RlmB [Syntrophales bacterium]|nr:23S rRNA (guanosine(2251)-2'-O)-methyltransferase RlmB [Syntrophales bacterium]